MIIKLFPNLETKVTWREGGSLGGDEKTGTGLGSESPKPVDPCCQLADGCVSRMVRVQMTTRTLT
jgi:hypothetical protein